MSRMGSRRFGGVLFIAYPQDHEPRHIHAFSGELEIICDLRLNGQVALALRKDALRPGNAKRSDVRKVLKIATENREELLKLWEAMHD